MILDLISLVTNFTYLALVIASLFTASGGRATSLRRLSISIRLFWWALAAGVVSFVLDVADIPDDGPVWPVLSAAKVACMVACLVFAYRRRAQKGEQVVNDAERTVRSWGGGL